MAPGFRREPGRATARYPRNAGGKDRKERGMKEHYTGAAHVAVLTCDIEESIRFYEKIGG